MVEAHICAASPVIAQQSQPERLPQEVVDAWVKAGAKSGWIGLNEFYYPSFRMGEVGKSGEVPGFRFEEWKPMQLNQLPVPKQPFGLFLIFAPLTDSGLKELAAMKELHTLDLTQTKITDAGLKELGALKGLQTLNLTNTRVTDIGLKELAQLKDL